MQYAAVCIPACENGGICEQGMEGNRSCNCPDEWEGEECNIGV